MNIKRNISELIGKTPLLELSNIENQFGIDAHIFAKLEYFNPAGSAKDRVALRMIDEAEESGQLKKGGVIIEPTSGNTGIGLCAVAASRGYKTIIVMPSNMSAERIKLMKAYGAEVILTDATKGLTGAIEKAEEVAKKTENGFIAGQFTNMANARAHRDTTGPEIYEDTDGEIDIFIAGVGTGGTITGTGQYLKSKNKKIEIVAVEPATSAVLSGEKAGPHGLQGIGAGFIPDVLDTSIYDEVMKITDKNAYDMARLIAKKEGILVGISSGAAAYAAVEIAKRSENSGKNIVVILPDLGDRYLSTDLFG